MGSGYAAWLKKHRRSKHSRGEASTKDSETGKPIQRDHGKDEGTTMQLRPRGTCNNSEPAHTLDKESSSPKLIHGNQKCYRSARPTTSTNQEALTDQPAQSLTTPESERWVDAPEQTHCQPLPKPEIQAKQCQMSNTDVQTQLCPVGSLTRQPYDEPKNPRDIRSLKLTSTVS